MNAQKAILLAGLGLELVGLILVAAFFGQWVDQNQHWGGWGVILFSLLALVGWFIHLVQMLKKVFL